MENILGKVAEINGMLAGMNIQYTQLGVMSNSITSSDQKILREIITGNTQVLKNIEILDPRTRSSPINYLESFENLEPSVETISNPSTYLLEN